ncbi:MAG TPA: VOC family protein [Mesorhizobium sp.]|jgi:hypothetical protein|nr:VOC family protein [Mesorhizobium sp.]
MPKMIFMNLPVSDLGRAIRFYEGVGAVNDKRFSDGSAAMMSFSEAIHVMLLTHERFRSFTTRPMADTHATTSVLLCLSEDSRAEVDATLDRAKAAGGVADPNPSQDYGFMYGRSFEDPDGHIWEVMWMDVEAAMKAGAAHADQAA